MDDQEVDVLIIGAGPAGAACALGLLRYSDCRVWVLDNGDLQQVRVGEHVSSSIFDFLDYLKVDKRQFDDQCFTANYGKTSYWGSDIPSQHDSLFTTAGTSYQLKRELFDLELLKQVADAGGHVLPRSQCLSVEQNDQQEWTVDIEHERFGAFQINAQYLVDASGRKAFMSRRLGIPRRNDDRLMGVGTFLQFNDGPLNHDQLIETTELGWWYTATLSDNTAVATFFSDADIISRDQLQKPENWNQCLQQTKHMRKRLQGSQTTTPNLWVKDASSQVNDLHQRSHFIAIGDAAAAFDPVSSMGLGFALSSACVGAKALQATLANGNEESLAVYDKDIQNNFTQYQTNKRQVYGQEQRWPSATFWQRRQDNVL
jgi:flavin-dependent dehydrogenase